MPRTKRELSFGIVRALAGIVSLAAITLFGRLLPINATTAALAYLLVVLLIATHGSLIEAILVSLIGGLCLNYFFLTPLFHFTIANPQDWVALFVFLIVAVLVGELSSTARTQTQAAVSRSREMEQLYALSRAALLNTSPDTAARDVALEIARVFNFTGVSLYERDTEHISRAGALDVPEWDDRLRLAAINGTFSEDPATSTVAISVRLGAEITGSLVLRGERISDSAQQSLANLVAIALERARMQKSTTAAELVRKSEELKSTLLDAIAHEFKTPLTSIKAAASALRAGTASAAVRDEYIEIVDEESDRLEHLVTDAIKMARIEAGELQVERRNTFVSEIVEQVVSSLTYLLDGRTIIRNVPPQLEANADPELIQLALKQVIDNARKYSPSRTPITIEAGLRDDEVLITVFNLGPGIQDADRRRIFDRYYRSPATRDHVSGTGIGLSIAREIMSAHGGKIWAENVPGEGSRILLLLPAAVAVTAA